MAGTKRKRVKITMSNAVEESELGPLSALPDSLILHILCLLKDTKIAVQTCVLSKRWRYIWIHLPSLYLDNETYKRKPPFRKFVHHIMSKRKPDYKIQTLRFWCREYNRNFVLEHRLMDKFIPYAADCGVEELDTNNKYFLKACCAAFSGLTSLKIRSLYQVDIPFNSQVFASITRLHLEYIKLCEDGSGGLFSGCVNLEELILIGITVFKISCSNLVRFTLWDVWSDTKLIVSAPRLLELNLKDMNQTLLLDECSCLEKVNIRHGGGQFKSLSKFVLQSLYEKVIKNILPKTKSLVVQHYSWKMVFMKCKDFDSIEIFAPKIDVSVAILTWKMDAELSNINCLKYDQNGGDFVEIFGKIGFVSFPDIISSCKCNLDTCTELERIEDAFRKPSLLRRTGNVMSLVQ